MIKVPVTRFRRIRAFVWTAVHSGLMLRYGAVALVKVALDFAAFNAIIAGVSNPDGMHLLLANSSGFLAAGWVAYRLNSSFAFRVERHAGDFGRFLAVSLIGGLLYNAALLVLVSWFGASGPVELNLAKVAALGSSVGWNFVGYALFVFRRPEADGAVEAARRPSSSVAPVGFDPKAGSQRKRGQRGNVRLSRSRRIRGTGVGADTRSSVRE